MKKKKKGPENPEAPAMTCFSNPDILEQLNCH